MLKQTAILFISLVGAAMFTLIRNVGSAIGILVLQAMTIRNTAIVHSRLGPTYLSIGRRV